MGRRELTPGIHRRRIRCPGRTLQAQGQKTTQQEHPRRTKTHPPDPCPETATKTPCLHAENLPQVEWHRQRLFRDSSGYSIRQPDWFQKLDQMPKALGTALAIAWARTL